MGARGFNMSTQENSLKSVSSEQQISVTSLPIVQTIGALIFGIMILFAVGFAPMDVAHNVAHDTRHTLAFPCH